jgi:hypothetical protein
VTDDPRGRRVAVVADSLLTGTLAELRDGGWGVIQLPPADLDADTARDWLALTAEQVAEYRRTGYEVKLVDDGVWSAELAAALAAVGVDPLVG